MRYRNWRQPKSKDHYNKNQKPKREQKNKNKRITAINDEKKEKRNDYQLTGFLDPMVINKIYLDLSYYNK